MDCTDEEGQRMHRPKHCGNNKGNKKTKFNISSNKPWNYSKRSCPANVIETLFMRIYEGYGVVQQN